MAEEKQTNKRNNQKNKGLEQAEGQENLEAGAEDQSEGTQEETTEAEGSNDSGEQPEAEQPQPEAAKTVTVTAPKAFQLRLDNHNVKHVKAGIQEMLEEHANHWYSKAHGVEIYKPETN